MRNAKSKEDLRTLRVWASEIYSRKYRKPLNIPREQLFEVMRESDLIDIRKVIVLVPYQFPNHNFNGKSCIYWGMEDAVRTLYREGCDLYSCGDMVRMSYPSGFMVEFHRLEFLKESDEDKINIGMYLRAVRQNHLSRQSAKVKLKWKDRNGKHSN